jgi:VWFA-related protein
MLQKGYLLWFSLAAFAASPLRAQTPPTTEASKPPQTAASAIKVETRIVLLDVVVTDHKGSETIPNLRQEDFQVTEDGKPQAISAFEEHQRETSAPVSLPALPPNVYTNLQPVKPGDSVNVLLIDLLNTQPWFQKGVSNQAIKYLKTVPPGTRLAIFTLSTQLRMVRGFTTDFSGLAVALDDKNSGVIPESSWLNPSPSRRAAEDWGLAAMILMQASPAAVGAVNQYLGEEAAFKTGNRSELTLQAFEHLARYLSGIPARKNVIWFADTFPISFVPENKVHTPRHQEHVQQTSDMLTAAQVAIYPVSARGLVVDGTFDVPLAPGEKILDEFATTQIAMEAIAQDTGGRAFYNTNGLDAAMAKAIDEGSHYYTLAYAPTNNKTDGRYRRIEVKLTDAGYKLSYRRGYYADKPTRQSAESASEDPLIPLVGFGMPNFDQITYKIQAAPVHPQPALDARRAGLNTEMKGPFTRYGVDVVVSLPDFVFETTPDGVRHGRLEAILIAYDRDGKIINVLKRKSRLALEPEVYGELQKKGLPFHLEIDVPSGDIYLRTGIYDLGSGHAGTLGFPLTAVHAIPTATK